MDKIKPSTVTLYKIIIKTLLNETNPELAKSVKAKRIYSEITPDQLLTDEDINKLIESATTIRDKAIIACLADSGARKGELLSTKIIDVKFDNYGCVIWLRKSKTKPRPARLIFASGYLRAWLSCHPDKDNPEAYIFCNSRPPYNSISRGGFYNMIERLGKRANIGKRINPHNFRHSRATDLSKKVKSEQKLKAVMGWTPGSSMASRYIHLSGADIDDALLEANGIKKEESEVAVVRAIQCKRCKEWNSVAEKVCLKCGYTGEGDINSEIDVIKAEYEAREARMKKLEESMAKLREELDRRIKVQVITEELVEIEKVDKVKIDVSKKEWKEVKKEIMKEVTDQ